MWSATRYNERVENRMGECGQPPATMKGQRTGWGSATRYMWSATRYNERVENRMGECGQPPATTKG